MEESHISKCKTNKEKKGISEMGCSSESKYKIFKELKERTLLGKGAKRMRLLKKYLALQLFKAPQELYNPNDLK